MNITQYILPLLVFLLEYIDESEKSLTNISVMD